MNPCVLPATELEIVKRKEGFRFLCEGDGTYVSHAVFIPTVAAAFSSLPSALRWLRDQCDDEAGYEDYKERLCAKYKQRPDAVPMALPFDQIDVLGYETWRAEYKDWWVLSTVKGIHIDKLLADHTRAAQQRNRRKRKREGKPLGIVLPQGKSLYLSAAGGFKDIEAPVAYRRLVSRAAKNGMKVDWFGCKSFAVMGTCTGEGKENLVISRFMRQYAPEAGNIVFYGPVWVTTLKQIRLLE